MKKIQEIGLSQEKKHQDMEEKVQKKQQDERDEQNWRENCSRKKRP